ncbi:lasso peptide biosynthesis B2 protein [Sphingomonas sabuli]|uniref:Lasso peptide biosynthesis B2 protein n=1 Tax=Sphingomonas sabuli TaxID=2764186 RepID=A0A7G9L3Z6_9SPHN|nr:lasso peptide biosynthesis B2 protein [Sphingomonas sabuli]QNM83345.1 lasso peptide biosynthesis B2 protein [Sphingomonas sabuli]
MDLTAPTFGLVNGHPLFLDLATDSYFLLEPDDESELLKALQSNAPSQHPRPVDWPKPASQVTLVGDPSRPRFADILFIGASLTSVRRRLRRGLLADLISGLFEPPAGDRDTPETVGLARRFLCARRWLPHQGNCLADSLALLIFLQRHGATASLIFGAKLDPFAAHCWLQAGPTLLNDRLDRIEGFTPVAALSP